MKINEQLRQALKGSGLTLFEVARRAQLPMSDVARVLGRRVVLPPLDLVEAVGHALGMELVFAAEQARRVVSEPRTLVDEVIEQLAPERLAKPEAPGFKVLALDLEATLISSAVSAITRPGLYDFLEAAHGLFGRVVMYTTVPEPKVRELARLFVREKSVPPWFADIEYVHWTGLTKDLSFVPNVTAEQVLLVDDMQELVHVGQEAQWVRIRGFDPSAVGYDDELPRVLEQLVDRVVGRTSAREVRP